MTAFSYRGRDTRGALTTGTIASASATAALAALQVRGLTVVSLREQRPASLSVLGGGRVRVRDLAAFAQQFATIVGAGLPVLRCLAILEEQTGQRRLATAISGVHADVEAGLALSAAMQAHPRVFNPLFCSMVHAGEMAGSLDIALHRIARQLEKDEAVRRAIRSALAYPLLVGCFALAVLLGMILFLVPVFADMYRQLGDAQLPLLTRTLVSLSDGLRSWPGLLGSAALALAIRYILGLRRRARWAPLWDRVRLRAPFGIGELTRRIALARFARTLASLTTSGVPLLPAIAITGQTAGNAVITEALNVVQEAVTRGESISMSLRQAPVFPPMVVQMIAIGEETGALDTLLGKVADFYEDEVDARLKSLTSVIEPLLMLFVGAVVGLVVIAMYLPIFTIMTLVD